MTRLLVYVAGPLTKGDLLLNVRAAVLAADEVRRAGHSAFVPHLNALAEMISPMPYEDWMSEDLDILTRCDVVLRLPGESPGADRETRHAAALSIPVVHSVAALADLVHSRA